MFLDPYNFWNMDYAAPLSLNQNPDSDLMSSQYPQALTLLRKTDLHPIFSSIRLTESTRKGLLVSFAFFQRYYLPHGRVNESVAAVEELSDCWKPSARD